MPKNIPSKRLAAWSTLLVIVALVVAACGDTFVNESKDKDNFSLGGDSQVVGLTATPTAARPPTPTGLAVSAGEGEGENGGEQPATSPPVRHPGSALFIQSGCATCHTIDTLDGPSGTLGPNLTQVGGRAGERIAGLSGEEYLRQSIEDPGAFIVPSFSPLMPAGLVSGSDLNTVVEYLLTLQ